LEPSRPKPVTRRRELAFYAVPMVLLAIGGYVGNALWATLLSNEPAVLLAIAPRLRWLLLASPRLEWYEFYGIPLVRAFGVLSLYYAFGKRYGETALQWMEDRTSRRAMRPIRWIERQFHRARYIVVAWFPGTIAALLCGADRASYSVFITVAMVATTIRLFLIRTLADVFEGTLQDVLDWIGSNQLWLTGASIVVVFVYAIWTSGDSTQPVESVESLAEELDEAAAEAAAEAGDGPVAEDPEPERT
jgi:hypothetical protein